MIINDDVSIGFTIISHRQSFSLTFLHLGVITIGCPNDLISFELTIGTLMLRDIHWSCISSNV